MMQIRKIKPEDIQFVLDMAKDNNCLEGKLLSNIEGFLICENDKKRCGCGCLVMSEGKGYLGWVMVSEDSRGRKLGGTIMKALLNIADINGIKDVYAAPLPTGMCGEFLTAMGFEAIASTSVRRNLKEVLGLDNTENYHVSMDGYFKSCTGK